MLQTLLDLYENHPHEDTHTLALIVVGILKVAAILKSVSPLWTCMQIFLVVLCNLRMYIHLLKFPAMYRNQ